MSTLISAAATAGPLAAGWSVHTLWMRRRIEAARRDPLTGLYGRDAFTARARSLLGSGQTVVVLVDVNNFKRTNDTRGHAAGDAVLAAIGDRMNGGLVTLAGRLGGDEFAGILRASPDRAEKVIRSLHDWLCVPAEDHGRLIDVSVSVGAAVVAGPHRADWADVLSYAIRRADEAMYDAKRTGGGWKVVAAADPVTHATVNGRRDGRPGTGNAPEGATP
jgi:diguanylate cyclase (GGDEF)-like protein